MKAPLFVRPLTPAEYDRLVVGLRSPEAFVLRRCQLLLASARGERAPTIATQLGCATQTVLNVIHRFEQDGIEAVLTRTSSRPKTIWWEQIDAAGLERLRTLLHTSPRAFGKPTSLWTLDLVAEVAWTDGITRVRVSDETIRRALQRLGVRWQRAKQWITSPDPAYAAKKGSATG